MSNKVKRIAWQQAKQQIGNSKRGLLIKTFLGAGWRVKSNGVVMQRQGDYLEAR